MLYNTSMVLTISVILAVEMGGASVLKYNSSGPACVV